MSEAAAGRKMPPTTGSGVATSRAPSLGMKASTRKMTPATVTGKRLTTPVDPSEAVVEKVFVNVNAQATLLLGQARGAALCAAVTAGLNVHEYTALQVKQAVVGYGKADKIQVQKMVQRLLALDRAPGPDAADALACSICHAHSRTALRAIAAPKTASRGGRARAAWSEYALRSTLPKGGA